MAKSHPHIDSPTPEQLMSLVAHRPAELANVYLALHEIIVETVPEIEFSVDEVDAGLGYGAHQFGYNGWGMAALSPHNKWIRLTLLQGARLDDPAKILEGTSVMRHLKVRTAEQIEANRVAIKALLLAALTLNQD